MRIRVLLLVLTIAATTALVAGAHAAPVATAAKSCRAPDYPGSGYFTSLSVKHVTCAFGRKLTLAHYRCRTENGRAGRCHRKVLHYTCKETRSRIATEIDGRVTCTRGARKVIYTYQQNL